MDHCRKHRSHHLWCRDCRDARAARARREPESAVTAAGTDPLAVAVATDIAYGGDCTPQAEPVSTYTPSVEHAPSSYTPPAEASPTYSPPTYNPPTYSPPAETPSSGGGVDTSSSYSF